MVARARKRLAVVDAATVNVVCPHCGAAQDGPSGSQLWTIDELREMCTPAMAELGWKCQSCDAPMILHVPSRVGVPAVSP